MARHDIEIATGDGTAKAGLFRSPGGEAPRAGVILYMDAFGPRSALDAMAERLAGQGYAVLVPDLFYRKAPYGPFDARTAFSEEKTKAALMALVAGTTQEMTARDTGYFLDALAAHGVTGPVGTVGYCIGMFLILNGANLALVGLRTRRLGTAEPAAAATGAGATEPGSLTVYVWTPTGQATTPAGQRLIRRYVASVDKAGRFSTGHAALQQGDDLYVSHYPAVEIDRSPANLRSSLRAGPENDVPGRFLPSHAAEVADWCPATVAVTLNGIDAARLRAFWAQYSRDTTYNFISRNCSTTVARALDIAVEGTFSRGGHPWRQLAAALTTPEFWAAAFLRNGARSMTWTPGLVLDYTRALSALVDPASPVPSIAWKRVGWRLLRNWRARDLASLSPIARRSSVPGAGPTEA